tara:strand:+ start:94 stop:804 length:711 start_codon:yes stop_codon:yes gene_type:complete
MEKPKPNILTGAKPGTRIFNKETGIYYIRNKEGTWQKDDSFFNQVGRALLPVFKGTKINPTTDKQYKNPLKQEFDNKIGADGSYDVKQWGFTIDNTSPLSSELVKAEETRVRKRDLVILDNLKSDLEKNIKRYKGKDVDNYYGRGASFNRGAEELKIANLEKKLGIRGNNNTPGEVAPMTYKYRLQEFNKPVIQSKDNKATVKSVEPGEAKYPWNIQQLQGINNLNGALKTYSGEE